MCSIFVSIFTTMENNNYQGDLTDIIRASGGAEPQQQHDQWHHNHNHDQFSSDIHPLSFSSILEGTNNIFGDPLYSTLRDPFLQQLDTATNTTTGSSSSSSTSSSTSYFNITTTSTTTSTSLEQQGVSIIDVASSAGVALHDHQHHDIMRSRRPICKNIFSNMIQISPNNAKLLPYDSNSNIMAPSPRPIINKPSSSSAIVNVSPNININAKDSLLDNNNTGGGGGVQISSSRNTNLKRRKNQAKKVVCIPAPAAANSRQTGEVVPSDLWAWRKYGQKPIKGSPYPRGYYRCSSSKGCSARKQVERSRTDPNMLVITYTSEHNHPWPTQRNALAGSTRSQPTKNNNASIKNSSETSSQLENNTTKPKEEESNNNSDGNDSPVNVNAVKEEMELDIEKQFEIDEGEFSDGLSYKPTMIESNQSHEDFFAELGEIEADPLNLLFNQGFGSSNVDDHQRESSSKGLDPFHLFDWSGDNNTNNSFEEPNKRRL